MSNPRTAAARLTRRAGRAATAWGLAVGLALTTASCGDGEGDGTTASELSTTEHNDADVAFASAMVQHHAQALTMVDLTRGRSLDPEVERLAEDIRAAQGPEIETMADWLQDWGEDVPATMRDHVHAGHGDGEVSESMEGLDHDMPGMMSAEDLAALEEASDADFQELWLELMVEHHEGAVEMARAEQEDGRYRPAVELAGEIADAQTAEIEQMQALLDS